MNKRSLTMALLLAATALAFMPTAQAETCSTTLYHPLGGQPALQVCSGNPGYGSFSSRTCTVFIFDPLGNPLIYKCEETFCGDSSCWVGFTYYTNSSTGGNRIVGTYLGCVGDSTQPSHPGFDNTWCQYGIYVAGTSAIIYLEDQDVTEPGVCVTVNNVWNCVHTYPTDF